MLRVSGWRVENAPPDLPKMVIVVAPHTSNWDFYFGVATMLALDLDPSWLGKHTLFRAPVGGLLRRLGGVPVRRHGGGASGQEGSVAAVVEAFRAAERMVLALAPEGTRGRVTRWKSGYYVIAEAAGVPVVPSWIDWSRRVVGFGDAVPAEGGADALSARLAASFRPEMARRPDAY
jgi:1-acyl-sn-glycerol-3-phosphate acyltransferase